MELQDKVAIITGGGTGIGKTTAQLFAAEGATVVIAGRRAALLEETAAEIRRAGGRVTAISTDVTDPAEVDRLFIETERLLARIDILLTCAGVFISGKETQDFTLEEWDRTMGINFRGTMLCSTRVVPYLKKAGGGIIINCTSVSGRMAQRRQTPYNVSKAAVEMMAKCMALELGPYNIKVNTICPGLTETGMAAGQIAARGRDACVRPNAIKRLGLPMDTAQAALYLASDRAAWITGTSLVVDGGYSSR